MTTPYEGCLFHITHINNLAGIAGAGLWSDNAVVSSNTRIVEIGERDIKQRRRNRPVPVPPGGRVADYVPFYFAARSPMLFSIHKGNVPTYQGGQDEVVYLVTDTAAIVGHGLEFAFTDRNAATDFAEFGNDLDDIDDYVNWTLMKQKMWNNISSERDRRERRMAEMLVRTHVPWSAFVEVATRTDDVSRAAASALATVGATTMVRVRPDWYF
ncbi:type II toxin-antitoxin system toxin DNA ADP-ribosyl transferase DarT [Candidatus Poriferisodalis sp.]|uniref:type II toxin-antitoxin system toxin DNA ADP-ribosyl transferase DarT n=1 Tax=Candidatus Poriferisodalis sp. TaxID=3101277 RepID=UPI003B5286CA